MDVEKRSFARCAGITLVELVTTVAVAGVSLAGGAPELVGVRRTQPDHRHTNC